MQLINTKKRRLILAIFIPLILVGFIFYIVAKTRKAEQGQKGAVEIGRTGDNKPITVTYDLKYSFKDYTNQNLKNADDLDGKTIYATMFLQEIPDSHIFPAKMKGVTFVNCNLDNVYIPEGNTVIGGSQRRFQVQNDLRDWLIDENNNPTEVLDKEHWESLGYSVDPRDIPSKPLKDISEIKKIDPVK